MRLIFCAEQKISVSQNDYENTRDLANDDLTKNAYFGSITLDEREFGTRSVFWNTACSENCCFFETAMFRTCRVLDNASGSKLVFFPKYRDIPKYPAGPERRYQTITVADREAGRLFGSISISGDTNLDPEAFSGTLHVLKINVSLKQQCLEHAVF